MNHWTDTCLSRGATTLLKQTWVKFGNLPSPHLLSLNHFRRISEGWIIDSVSIGVPAHMFSTMSVRCGSFDGASKTVADVAVSTAGLTPITRLFFAPLTGCSHSFFDLITQCLYHSHEIIVRRRPKRGSTSYLANMFLLDTKSLLY